MENKPNVREPDELDQLGRAVFDLVMASGVAVDRISAKFITQGTYQIDATERGQPAREPDYLSG
jgi:hypothetical protein